MNVLVLNCGSSSVKFQIIDTDAARIAEDSDRTLASGQAERIGAHALIELRAEGHAPVKQDKPLRSYREAIDLMLGWIASKESPVDSIQSFSDIDAVGHRVVHGGEHFQDAVDIDDAVLTAIEEHAELAPLHNPANAKGVRAAREVLGAGVPQVAVFDTAFHTTMPESSYLYGIPYHLYRRYKIRRYGFHGTSHRYVAYRYAKMLGLEPDQINIITLHLGNGCSACAIRAGKSYDTSMGFTPLEGLLMGTRCGDLDPAIIDYLAHREGMSPHEIDTMLNKESGLLGLSGLTGDMRDLLAEERENQDRRARLAIDVFCHRARKYIGAYLTIPPRADAVVFTAGIGERSPEIRRRICRGLDVLGLELDTASNERCKNGASGKISKNGARLAAYVIPTNEELMIARDTCRVVASGS